MKKIFSLLICAVLVVFGLNSCSPEKSPNDAQTPEIPSQPTEPDTPQPVDPAPDIPQPGQGKTIVVYYSYTNNTHTIVTDLLTQIEADVVRVEPAEKGLDYAANNYAIGSAQIQAIRNNPSAPSSYPAIDPVEVDFEQYSTIIVATPLWWSNMAASMQTFLFKNGGKMAGKRIGLIVSSASSGISGVESDARRLIPDGTFVTSLWIRSAQTSLCHSLTADWLSNYIAGKD